MTIVDHLRRSLPRDGRIVIAVSGGADSTALLAAACELGRPVIASHVNHGLRGPESDADQAFVEDMARRLGAAHRSERAIVVAPNIESKARAARYAALCEIAVAAGADTILTAHTADDQAETVLHRLIRGCGLAGLAGIQPRRRMGSITIVRPWLGVRRQELRDYLNSRGLTWREDSSNADRTFTRNRLRADVLPLLEQSFNRRIVEQLARLAIQADEYRRRERRRVNRQLAAVELPRAGVLTVFHAGRLAAMDRDTLRSLWPALWRRERWRRGQLGFDHWDRIAGVCLGDATAVDLPDGIRVRRLDRVVRIGPGA